MVSPSVAREHGPVLVEGGHFSLARDGTPLLSETTTGTFRAAAIEVAALRRAGCDAAVGLMVGDLALPGTRPAGGPGAVPPEYREVLAEVGLTLADLRVWTESYARNQGKRRLLDEARLRHDPAGSYVAEGWALFVSAGGELQLVSDASLGWDGDVHAAVVARGGHPLCPLVFAGLKRAIFQAGFGTHVSHYALADDHWIDVKLRAGAAAVAQLRHGRAGAQVDRIHGPGPVPRIATGMPPSSSVPARRPGSGFSTPCEARAPT